MKTCKTERNTENAQDVVKFAGSTERSRKTGKLPRIICRICDRFLV